MKKVALGLSSVQLAPKVIETKCKADLTGMDGV